MSTVLSVRRPEVWTPGCQLDVVMPVGGSMGVTCTPFNVWQHSVEKGSGKSSTALARTASCAEPSTALARTASCAEPSTALARTASCAERRCSLSTSCLLLSPHHQHCPGQHACTWQTHTHYSWPTGKWRRLSHQVTHLLSLPPSLPPSIQVEVPTSAPAASARRPRPLVARPSYLRCAWRCQSACRSRGGASPRQTSCPPGMGSGAGRARRRRFFVSADPSGWR
eukprot:362645-Chlamydomonas_euryale.AAC.4